MATGRSATIVAAYLMYTRNLDTEAALDMIRAVRPNIECVRTDDGTSTNSQQRLLDLIKDFRGSLKYSIKRGSRYRVVTRRLGCSTWKERWRK